VTLTGIYLQIERLVLQQDAGATSPWTIASGVLTIEMLDADLDSGLGNNYIVCPIGSVQLVMRGTSRIFAATALGLGGLFSFDLYDRSTIDSTAIGGSGGPVTIRAIDNETVTIGTQFYAGTVNIETPHKVFHGALNETQVGTTELHIGSVKLEAGTRLLATSAAMLGGSIPAETANLRLRRFTGGTIVATWTVTGSLGEVLLGSPVSITDTDWYDIYLYAGAISETAIVKGLVLYSVKE
jgi:hypothetical protein